MTTSPIDWNTVSPNGDGIRIPDPEMLWQIHDDITQSCPKPLIINVSHAEFLRHWAYWSGPSYVSWKLHNQVVLYEMESDLHWCIKAWFCDAIRDAQVLAGIPEHHRLLGGPERTMRSSGVRPNGWYVPKYSRQERISVNPEDVNREYGTMVTEVGVSQNMASIQRKFRAIYRRIPLTRIDIGVEAKSFTTATNDGIEARIQEEAMEAMRDRQESERASFYIHILAKKRVNNGWEVVFNENVGNADENGEPYNNSADSTILRLGMGNLFYGFLPVGERWDEQLIIPLENLVIERIECVKPTPRMIFVQLLNFL